LPTVVAVARADGIAVAVHLEPYPGRTVATTVDDLTYLRTYGVRTFYVYRALDLPITDWVASKAALHVGGSVLFAQTALAGAAAAAGFDGIYTYDIVTYGGDKFSRICSEAHAEHLACAPSVGPGYDARRGSGDPRVKSRHGWRDLRLDVALGPRGQGGSRHDHVVQRMARRHHRSSRPTWQSATAATGISPTTGRGGCTVSPPRTRI